MAGRGLASNDGPRDVSHATVGEVPVGGVAAGGWGPAVIVHADMPFAIEAAIAAGIRCIHHWPLAEVETVRAESLAGGAIAVSPRRAGL